MHDVERRVVRILRVCIIVVTSFAILLINAHDEMATTTSKGQDLNFEELKENGNECIHDKCYNEAIRFYSAALAIRPTEHTVYSNRSLANLREGRLQDALSDANRCIELNPKFARGYMRKAVTLNALESHEEACKAAVTGYTLRGSDSIGKECIAQWLASTKALFSNLYTAYGALLPTGTAILSNKCFLILVEIQQSRLSPTMAMSSDKMRSSLITIVTEMKHTLGIFAHSADPCTEEWVDALHHSSEIDPKTATLPRHTMQTALACSENLARWVNEGIDSILYPIVRPFLMIVVMVVLAHTNFLTGMNLRHQNVQLLCQACLVIFEKSVLNLSEYLGYRLVAISNFLDSFIQRGIELSKEDLQIMKHYCAEAERLLPMYASVGAWEYEEIKDLTTHCTANAKILLHYIATGELAHSKFIPKDSLMTGETAKLQALQHPTKVKQFMTDFVKDVKTRISQHLFTQSDAKNLINGAIGLHQLGDHQQALECFKLGERIYFTVFAQQAQSGLWSLEEAPPMITAIRHSLFRSVLVLKDSDKALLGNAVVQWKCLFSEFRTMLIRLGLSSSFQYTFKAIDSLKRSDRLSSDFEQCLLSASREHQQNEKPILNKWGQKVMGLLSGESIDLIGKVLEPGEAVLDIMIVPSVPSDYSQPDKTTDIGVLLLITPERNLVHCVDFSGVFDLANQWKENLNLALSKKDTDTQKHQEKADQMAMKIRQKLLPPTIESVISSETIDYLYICPDLSLGNFPLDTLIMSDGRYLFEHCAVSYLSSSRECLREHCIMPLLKHNHLQDKPQYSESQTTSTARDQSTPYSQANLVIKAEPPIVDCLIFANPDYDMKLEKPEEESTLIWKLLKKGLNLSPQNDKKKLESLPMSQVEAEDIKDILRQAKDGTLKVQIISGKNATIKATLEVKSPLILHFSTHGFSHPSGGSFFGGNFWTDMTTGLALAGMNTFYFDSAEYILPECGSGELTAMAVCGMDLSRTRLVFLSTCLSSFGLATIGESIGSLAQAFRAAGADTVIATQWPVVDDAAQKFAVYFYQNLSKPGTRPSLALTKAKNQLREEAHFSHWSNWGPFICLGYDTPVL